MEDSEVGSLFPWLLPSRAGSVLTTSLGLYQEPSPSLLFSGFDDIPCLCSFRMDGTNSSPMSLAPGYFPSLTGVLNPASIVMKSTFIKLPLSLSLSALLSRKTSLSLSSSLPYYPRAVLLLYTPRFISSILKTTMHGHLLHSRYHIGWLMYIILLNPHNSPAKEVFCPFYQ